MYASDMESVASAGLLDKRKSESGRISPGSVISGGSMLTPASFDPDRLSCTWMLACLVRACDPAVIYDGFFLYYFRHQ